MERGQITIPKKYREKLGIKPETPLNVTLERERIIVEPLRKATVGVNVRIVLPKLSRKEYLAFLKGYKGGLWTVADDRLRKRLLEKDRERLQG